MPKTKQQYADKSALLTDIQWIGWGPHDMLILTRPSKELKVMILPFYAIYKNKFKKLRFEQN